ncbi:NmrA family protein, partial [Staphylococcus aureus]
YKFTQANIHKSVMELFVNHMNNLADKDKEATTQSDQLFSTIAMTTGAVIGAYVGSKIYHLIKA